MRNARAEPGRVVHLRGGFLLWVQAHRGAMATYEIPYDDAPEAPG